jgi:lysophospholipase L1-like esterase
MPADWGNFMTGNRKNPSHRRWAAPRATGVSALVLSLAGLMTGTASAGGTSAVGETPRVDAPTASSGYVGTWAASPQPPTPTPLTSSPTDFSAHGFAHQTVREIVHTSVGGSGLLLRFSNVFGDRPVQLGAVTVGLSAGGAQVVSGTVHAVTFGGSGARSIPIGAELYSDPLPFSVPADSDLAVSIYLPEATGPATYHALALQTNFVATGDHSSQLTAAGFDTTTSNWYFLDGVDVAGPARAAVVAVGDSITDGYQSTPDANDRWPSFLAQRLDAQPGNTLTVEDEGISGNRVLHDSPCFGTSLLSRFDRDVLGQDGVRTVILLEGINDIGFSQTPNTGCTAPNTAVSAEEIIAGYRQVLARAHLHGLRVLGGTLTPFKGAAYWSPEAEAKRDAVNAFIRTGGEFDGVVDFAAAIADPADPTMIAPPYDSGDHLHPNDAGYATMAGAVDLQQLSRTPTP